MQNLIRVLLVEDNEDDAIYIRYLLRKNTWNRYEVVWARTFEEGLERMLEKRHDVGLFDYRLGGKNGLDLLRESYTRGCRAPIILLTGSESPEIDLEASSAGAADYICKTSLDTGRLERSIRYARRHAATLEALRESQNRFELFMKHVPCAVCIKNEDGRYLYVNETFEQMFDRPPREWIGKSDQDLFPAETVEQVLEHDREVLRTHRPVQTIETLPYRQGKRHWLASKFPMAADSGPRMLGVAAVDVTERVQAEEMLQQTTQLLDGILTHLPVAVCRLDEDGIVREWRGSGFACVGLEEQQLVEKKLTQLYPENGEQIAQALEGGSVNFVLSVEHQGRTHHFDSYFFFDQERGRGAIGLAINITDRVKAEEMIKQKSQMLNGIVANLPVIAGRIDEKGVVSEVDGFGLERFGMGAEAIIGKSSFEAVPRAKEEVQRALKGEAVNFSLDGVLNDQPWHLDNFLFFDAARGKGAIFFCRDVTEQKLLEKQLLDISNREQQRIGQDLHDGLGQQLTGIGLLTTALRDKLRAAGLPDAKDAQTIASLVQESISQTRALARGLCPVQLETTGLQSALEDLTFQIQQMHKVDCRLMASSSAVHDHSVAVHLYRIAQEAINNAVKHARAKRITVCLQVSKGRNFLSIRDDGKGFRMSKPKTQSLGLRIMSYRAGMIGGSLKVTTKLNKGTLVECTFRNFGEEP